MRIATLLPAATETAYALGLEPVAVSHACSRPPAAASKPSVTRCRIDPDASCADVDAAVRKRDDDGGVYRIDREALRVADPDLVVTQGVCDVCAVDRVLVEECIDELGLDATVLTTDAHSLDDVLDDVRRIGVAAGREERAGRLVDALRARIGRVADVAATAPETPRVAVLDWLDPVMVAGHWIPEMVDLAGGRYDLADAGSYSEPTAWEAVLDFDPEVLVAAPCGFPLDRCVEHLPAVAERDGWRGLSAVRNGRAYAVDGDAAVNCPGPRAVDTLEHLAGLLHPDRFEAPPPDVCRPVGAPRPA